MTVQCTSTGGCDSAQAQPRGPTPRPRSGAAAKSAWLRRCRKSREELPHVRDSGAVAESARLRRCRKSQEELPTSEVRGSGREEPPHIQGQGWQPRVPGCDTAGAAERSYPMPEARGGSREKQPHIQGVVAARAQEGLKELLHVQGQEGRR